jgi:hypothetical protein
MWRLRRLRLLPFVGPLRHLLGADPAKAGLFFRPAGLAGRRNVAFTSNLAPALALFANNLGLRLPMHDSDPFRVPVHEPKPGTFHRPAHGFGIKFEPQPTKLKLSGAKTGEQGLGQGVMHLPLSGVTPLMKDEAP